LDAVSPRILNQNVRNFTLLNVYFKPRTYPSARCASATKAINRDNAKFNGKSVLTNELLAVDIFTKKIGSLQKQLQFGSGIDVSFEFCFNLVKLVVINLIIRGVTRQ